MVLPTYPVIPVKDIISKHIVKQLNIVLLATVTNEIKTIIYIHLTWKLNFLNLMYF